MQDRVDRITEGGALAVMDRLAEFPHRQPPGRAGRRPGHGAQAWWFFAEDKDIPYPRAAFRTSVRQAAVGALLTVDAVTLVRDMAVFPDRLDPSAEPDDALVTLLPGESFTYAIRGGPPLDPELLVSRPVLRCLND